MQVNPAVFLAAYNLLQIRFTDNALWRTLRLQQVAVGGRQASLALVPVPPGERS